MNSALLLATAEGGVQWGDFLFYLCTFLILIALVKHFAWGPVTEMMEKRADKIANDIDCGKKLAQQKAEELAAKRESALKDSHVEASKIIDRAKKNGEQQKLPS